MPNKNILPLAGKPLCWHVSSTLLQCKTIDDIYIYCSDEKVMDYQPEGVIFRKREKWLDGDLIRANDTYQAFISEVDADIYVAGLTTAPFVKAASIDNAVRQIISGEYDSAFAAQKLQTFAWFQGKTLNYNPDIIPRTQDLEPVFVETSGFFAFRKEIWTEHHRRIGFKPYIQIVDDIEAVDIDTREDYDFANIIAKAIGNSEVG